VVFASGVVLLFDGPQSRATPLSIHKLSFFAWLALMGLHLLVHLPGIDRSLGSVRLGAADAGLTAEGARSGAAGRWLAVGGALVGGLALAVVLIPHFGLWTAPGAFPHHHHGG
jgi:hypothetical protein